MIIGITGNFGSGKSTVASLFSKYKFKVINVDQIGHKLLEKKEVKDKVTKTFKNIETKGKIDRKKLKDIVFNNYKELNKLNKIIHPYILKEIDILIKKHKNIVLDAPLLIELNIQQKVNVTILVNTNKKVALKRINDKNKYTKKEIDTIFKSQLPIKEKLKHADFTINNNKTIKETEKKVKEILSMVDSFWKT